MQNGKLIRYVAIAAVLLLGVYWSAASAISGEDYPNAGFLASAEWLKSHKDDTSLIIVDVRMDKYFDGKLIPNAVRMPWQQFQYDDIAGNMGGMFVGIGPAQQLLGEHGISRNDTVVLYDSVKRDGGATRSYIFWVLDLLGHKNMKVLDRGIDNWIEAGGCTLGLFISGSTQLAVSGLYFGVIIFAVAMLTARLIFGKITEKENIQ